MTPLKSIGINKFALPTFAVDFLVIAGGGSGGGTQGGGACAVGIASIS